jgi:hypothetical protein
MEQLLQSQKQQRERQERQEQLKERRERRKQRENEIRRLQAKERSEEGEGGQASHREAVAETKRSGSRGGRRRSVDSTGSAHEDKGDWEHVLAERTKRETEWLDNDETDSVILDLSADEDESAASEEDADALIRG